MAIIDYSEEIKQSKDFIEKFMKRKKLYSDEANILSLCQSRYKLYYNQIHCYLAPKKDNKSEKTIQELINDIYKCDLLICENKIERFNYAIERYHKKGDSEKEALSWQYLHEWLQLYENDYALVAFRSLIHFCRFMEWDKPDKEKIWKYSIDANNDGGKSGVNYPFFYYFNRMVLKKDIKFISKQMPTGYGKTYGNEFAIAWASGVDCNNDFLYVVGNPKLVSIVTSGIVSIMATKRFIKVFPQYNGAIEYNETKSGKIEESVNVDSMFSVCRIKDGELTFAISSKVSNIIVMSKEKERDGVRARFLFLDDVCQSADAGNVEQHNKDIENYWNSWWKRNYGTDDFYIVIGGTAYSIYDILSTLIRYYSNGKMLQSPINKYTYTNENGDNIFIKIPKLDFDTDESTYPQKYPTSEARKMRERNMRSFMAMEQQQPLPPESSPFYWDNLETYDVIPESENTSCWASIDPVRIGGDNFSMPIHRKIGDFHYLIDCIYQNIEQEKLYQLIVDKIVQHHITQIMIERNTDTSLKRYLDHLLEEQSISFCTITERYNYEKKDIRITNQQNNIKTLIRFPAEHLYGRASQMGRFMFDLVNFQYKWTDSRDKTLHDDSIDSEALYCETYCDNKRIKSKMTTFDRR